MQYFFQKPKEFGDREHRNCFRRFFHFIDFPQGFNPFSAAVPTWGRNTWNRLGKQSGDGNSTTGNPFLGTNILKLV